MPLSVAKHEGHYGQNKANPRPALDKSMRMRAHQAAKTTAFPFPKRRFRLAKRFVSISLFTPPLGSGSFVAQNKTALGQAKSSTGSVPGKDFIFVSQNVARSHFFAFRPLFQFSATLFTNHALILLPLLLFGFRARASGCFLCFIAVKLSFTGSYLMRETLPKTIEMILGRITSRTYYTSRTKKPTLYSKISPLGNHSTIVPELDVWLFNGKKLRLAELQSIVRDFRKRNRFSHALQVSQWMHNNGICIFTPTEHAVHLDLIGKVHGFSASETYFNDLKDPHRTAKAYGALLNCYVRQHQTDKALSHLMKMKELGFASSPLTYNDIMCLYTNI
ncbi:hypothetical protein RJT34_14545 [Clitoria ternatea]|uniref:Pentatricopeptide repeat-containing protein n=1 Tax=Clitoria ternatea TaxID=43366 RepID=A0AAN9PMR9_CLITE